MIGGSGWLWLLAGLDSEIHNLKVRVKAPFRKQLREKYQREHNDENLFTQLIQEKNDIRIWCRNNHLMFTGPGLFLFHLIETYKKQGLNVKLISVGQNHGIAHYFQRELGLTATEIDIKDVENHNNLFEEFVSKNHDILSLDHTSYMRDKVMKREDFLHNMFKKVSELPQEENTIYLSLLLYVYDKEEEAISFIKEQPNIRSCYFQPDYTHWLKRMNKDDLNILIPHYDDIDKLDGSRKLSVTQKHFPNVPDWVFKKGYYPYHHFIYKNQNGDTGFYFMETKEKDELL